MELLNSCLVLQQSASCPKVGLTGDQGPTAKVDDCSIRDSPSPTLRVVESIGGLGLVGDVVDWIGEGENVPLVGSRGPRSLMPQRFIVLVPCVLCQGLE